MNEASRAALIEHLQGSEYDGKTVEQSHDYFHAPQAVAAVYEPDHTLYTLRQIYATIGAAKGHAVKTALTAMIAQAPYLADVLDMLSTYSSGGGISFGTDDFRSMIDSLVTSQVITSNEGEALKAIGRRQVAAATMQDAPIVRVLNPIADAGRPNVIPVNEFNECFTIARA